MKKAIYRQFINAGLLFFFTPILEWFNELWYQFRIIETN